MGPLIVLIVWLVVGAVVCIPACALCASLGRRWARNAGPSAQHQFAKWGSLLPVAAVFYLMLWAIVMSMISSATGRGLGFGDDFEEPLPNGYQWVAIDVTDRASIASPGGGDVFSDVVLIQQHGDWLAGAYDAKLDHNILLPVGAPDHWFLFNTRNVRILTASSEQELAGFARQQGFTLQLESAARFYDERRWRWYDLAIGLALMMPGAAALAVLYRKAKVFLRLRMSDIAVEQAAGSLRE